MRAGRHRRTSGWPAAVALGIALLASSALLGADPSVPPATQPAGPLTVARAWPGAKVIDIPGRLSDGTPFTPHHLIDAATSVGTARSPDNPSVRLVMRDGNGTEHELRRLPAAGNPQFSGFVAAGDHLVWAESIIGEDGIGRTRLWHLEWRSDASRPDQLTADVGDPVFFNSAHDLVVADGHVHWVAAARTKEPTTEVRSVSLTGGAVGIRRVDGAFALAGWPWLASAGGGGEGGRVELRNLADERRMVVPAKPSELVACAPTWCRVLVIAGSTGPARIEVMRPDGTDRRTIASGLVSATISDVAVLDRFEILTMSTRDGEATASQQLRLYDIAGGRSVVVAAGAGVVQSRAGYLWWSTGDGAALTWHILDLHTLT